MRATRYPRILYFGSGDTPREHKMSLYVDRAEGLSRAAAIDPVPLPPWLTEADIDVFATEYQRTGFRGGLNWYRNIDRNWELTAPWHGAKIAQPALFIAGTHDAVITGSIGQRALDELESVVPNLAQDPARRRRPLDPAGAPRRGERRADRIRARTHTCLRGRR